MLFEYLNWSSPSKPDKAVRSEQMNSDTSNRQQVFVNISRRSHYFNLALMLSAASKSENHKNSFFTWFVNKNPPAFTQYSHKSIPCFHHSTPRWFQRKYWTHSSSSPGLITFSEKVASFFLRSMIPQLLHRVILAQKSPAVFWDCNSISCFLCHHRGTKGTILSYFTFNRWVNLPEVCSSWICHRNIFLEVGLQNNSQNRAGQIPTSPDICQQSIFSIHTRIPNLVFHSRIN